MAMRYCPNCKKTVPVKMTGGQVAVAVLLFITTIIGLFIYLPLRAKKCAICSCKTTKIAKPQPKTKGDK